ncbi:MAG: metallophosphoesterase [Hyphomicrobiales bacterium]
MIISRRRFCAFYGCALAGALGLSTDAFGDGATSAPRITRYALTPPGWPVTLRLRIAVISDIHAGEPWVAAQDIARIVRATNELEADLIVLLGDFVGTGNLVSREIPWQDWGDVLKDLHAPLGVHAVLGNHDWWEDEIAMARRHGPTDSHRALSRANIPLYENDVVHLVKDGQGFWLAGLGDQLAFSRIQDRQASSAVGLDDLPGTLAKINNDDPVILLAHEPDIFPEVPDRVALTLSGHTHGGQVFPFGQPFNGPTHYSGLFAYGHIVHQGRHMIVTSGLGYSILPVRLGVPPELVVVELGEW